MFVTLDALRQASQRNFGTASEAIGNFGNNNRGNNNWGDSNTRFFKPWPLWHG